MKKVVIAIMLIVSTAYAQQITFEKYHPEIDRITSVAETPGGGFVVGSLNKAVTLLDKYGDVVWTKQFRSYNNFAHDVLCTNDGAIYVVTTWDGNKRDVFLHKLNLNGELIWTKQYGTSDDDNGFYIREAAGGGFMLFGTQLIKIDKDGNTEWQKANPVSFGINNFILPGNDGRIFISKNGQLNLLNSSGDLVWSKNFKLGAYSLIEMQGSLFYAGGKSVHKLDYDGNTIGSITVSDLYAIAEYDADKFVVAGKDSMLKYDKDFNLLWAKKIPNNTLPDRIKKVSDGYILTGEAGWILKTDKEANHKSLQLLKPAKNETVRPGSYMISWTQYDAPNVTLEYSNDQGFTWNTIASLTNKDSVQWNVPQEYFDAIVRIYKSDQPEIRDIAGPFHVHRNSSQDYIAVNQIWMYTGSNGEGSHIDGMEMSGLFWPAPPAVSAVFQDGLVWGGKIDGRINVNGNTYRQGLIPGKILSDGSADDRYSYKYNVWKINKFWESQPEGELKEQLKLNYNYWPGELGAPYKDVNSDGIFTRGTDTPEFPGDEVLWSVANDLDSSVTKFVYGSEPIGLEVQITTYGFSRSDDLQDVVFKKYKLINKGSSLVKDMYLSYFSDPDFGDAQDDFIGCDTILNLGYCYNSDNDDAGYYGVNPPAMGYKIVQGPIIESAGDSAFYDNRILADKKNLGTYSFINLTKGLPYLDPSLGSIAGAEQVYNYQSGKIWDGKDIIDPVTGKVTRYVVPGDPVTGTGWYEGPGWPGGKNPGDRRMLISTGPFDFAPGDTQEVVIAIIFARGTDNINSVAELKRKALVVQDFYKNRIITDVKNSLTTVLNYSLSQNYPNPFNPSTIIHYTLPAESYVEMNIYDILGKKVGNLVNDVKPAGEHTVSFNAQNFASGIYYYQLKTKDYLSTRKMVFIK